MARLQSLLLAFATCVVATRAAAADQIPLPPPAVYAIETVTIDQTMAKDLQDHLRTLRALRAKQGVALVAAYQVQFGSDISRVIEIWSGQDAEVLRRGLSHKDSFTPEIRKMITSDLIEVAELSPVPPLMDPAILHAKMKAYAIITVAIDPSKHEKFVSEMRGQRAVYAQQGIHFVGSYHVQLGNTDREIDIWAAEDAETFRRGFFAPDPNPKPGMFDEIKKSSAEIAELISLDAGR